MNLTPWQPLAAGRLTQRLGSSQQSHMGSGPFALESELRVRPQDVLLFIAPGREATAGAGWQGRLKPNPVLKSGECTSCTWNSLGQKTTLLVSRDLRGTT